MITFFNFLYFKYHLYDIARWREQEPAANPGRPTFS
jgi:hypothetical protein